jgi:hypothetical protein
MESNILFDTLYYEEGVEKIVLYLERVARDTLYRASLTWIQDPLTIGMLIEGCYELDDPDDGGVVQPTWLSPKAALRIIRVARNQPIPPS